MIGMNIRIPPGTKDDVREFVLECALRHENPTFYSYFHKDEYGGGVHTSVIWTVNRVHIGPLCESYPYEFFDDVLPSRCMTCGAAVGGGDIYGLVSGPVSAGEVLDAIDHAPGSEKK